MTTTDTTDAARWATGLELIVAARPNAVYVTLRDVAGWEEQAYAVIDRLATVPPTVTATWVRTQVAQIVADVLATLGMAVLQAHKERSSFSYVLAAVTAQAAAYMNAVWVPVEQLLRDELATRGVSVVEDDAA
jgi:hypothetical protein